MYMADLGLYLVASVLGAGYLFGQQPQERELKSDLKTTQPIPRSGENIYHSRDFLKALDEEARRVGLNWEASKDPIKSGIIPMYYNTINVKADSSKVPNNNYQQQLIYDVLQDLDADAKSKVIAQVAKTHQDGKESEPHWGFSTEKRQADPTNPMAQIGGSLIPGNEDFTHNNMVPFYKGNITQNTALDNRSKEGLLELYTGQFKLNKPQKTECSPLFAPVNNLTNIHGSVEQRDLSRYFPSNTGKKNNEAPTQRINVGPGLNKGFTAEPSGGFHDSVRIMPKSIEELRVDPVLETEGRINIGKSLVGARSLTGQVYRNRPELLVTNLNGERNFTTVGAVRGATTRGQVLLKHTNRIKSRSHTGIATSHVNRNKIAPGVQKSRKQGFLASLWRNLTVMGKQNGDFGKSGYRNVVTKRSLAKSRPVLNARGADGHTPHIQDKVRKTRKQFYTHNPQIYGHAGIRKPRQGPAYNPNEWIARKTIAETTEDNSHYGFMNQIGAGATVAYNPNEWIARKTIAETTEDNSHHGFMNQIGAGATVAYNPEEWAFRKTIKETTVDDNHTGFFNSTMKKTQAQHFTPAKTTIRQTTENNGHTGFYNSSMKKTKNRTIAPARVTIRETTENSDYIGPVSTIQRKSIAYNPKEWNARTTVKETTENNEHIGNVVPLQRKHVVINQDVARTTVKETTENDNRLGNIGGSVQNGGGYKTGNREAKNTNRQFTSDNDYTGAANSMSKKAKSYDSSYAARQNINKERIAVGRKPADGGPSLGYQNMNIGPSRKTTADRANNYTRVKNTSIGNMYTPNVILTTERNHLPQESNRLDISILDAYKSNPLTQPLNSY